MEFMKAYFAELAASGLLLVALAWLLNKWLSKRIETSIQAEYDKKKFLWEVDQRRREKAQLVAELLAEAGAHATNPQLSRDERRRLNKLSYEASLWLPEDIARELSKVLQHDPEAMNPHDLLLRVREELSGKHSLNADDVTVWQPNHELPNRGVPAGYHSGIVDVVRAELEVEGTRSELQFAANSICTIPEGAMLHLEFMVGGSSAQASTSFVRRVLRLGQPAAVGAPAGMRLQLFPTERGDDMNRRLDALRQAATAQTP